MPPNVNPPPALSEYEMYAKHCIRLIHTTSLPQVEYHCAERSAARVLGDGQDGQGVTHERQDRHGGEDGTPDHSLQRRAMILQEIRVTVTVQRGK